jgi:predicted hydrocarbon binding protein
MFDLFKKLLMARQLEIERGVIKVMKNRMALLPAPFMAYLLKLSKDPIKTGKDCYYSAKLTTYNNLTYVLEKQYGLTHQKLEQWMRDIAELMGWGTFDILNLDWNKKEAIIRIENSPVANEMGKVGYAVDHISRGATAGAISVIFQTDVDVIESKCVSKNDLVCEFDVKPNKKILFDSKLAKEQLYKNSELKKMGFSDLFRKG